MKKTLIPIAAIAAITLCSSMAGAANKSGSFTVSPFIGGYTFDGVQELDPAFIYGLRAGYNITKAIGVEGVFNFGKAESSESTSTGNGSEILNYRLEGLYHFLPDNRFVPFLAAGYGGTRLKYDRQDAMNAGAFDYGLGAKYFFTDNVALRGDLRHIVIDRGTTVYNYEYTLGVAFQFGGSKPAPQPVEEAPAAKVEPPPAPTSNLAVVPATIVKGQSANLSWESENTADCSIQPGIGSVRTKGSMSVSPASSTDYSLSCSGSGGSTSSNAALSVTQPAPKPAEPLDSDKDGVYDNLDKCPGTPAGVKVDAVGCPLDSDKDGVYDYLDKCPGTPSGVKVDAVGCPLDSDKDGVYDHLDQCPGTPAGVKVDVVGCPLDTDKDGVYDSFDKCPDTPLGTKVDKDGCTPPVVSSCKTITLEVEFDTAKADVKPKFDSELRKLADMLKDNPDATAVIEGHTDNVGAADMNMKLSDRRANSIRKYLIEKFGVSADRLEAKGFGLTKPRSTNKTAQGRHENRRVEAVIYCGGKEIKATDHDTHKGHTRK